MHERGLIAKSGGTEEIEGGSSGFPSPYQNHWQNANATQRRAQNVTSLFKTSVDRAGYYFFRNHDTWSRGWPSGRGETEAVWSPGFVSLRVHVPLSSSSFRCSRQFSAYRWRPRSLLLRPKLPLFLSKTVSSICHRRWSLCWSMQTRSVCQL